MLVSPHPPEFRRLAREGDMFVHLTVSLLKEMEPFLVWWSVGQEPLENFQIKGVSTSDTNKPGANFVSFFVITFTSCALLRSTISFQNEGREMKVS